MIQLPIIEIRQCLLADLPTRMKDKTNCRFDFCVHIRDGICHLLEAEWHEQGQDVNGICNPSNDPELVIQQAERSLQKALSQRLVRNYHGTVWVAIMVRDGLAGVCSGFSQQRKYDWTEIKDKSEKWQQSQQRH